MNRKDVEYFIKHGTFLEKEISHAERNYKFHPGEIGYKFASNSLTRIRDSLYEKFPELKPVEISEDEYNNSVGGD